MANTDKCVSTREPMAIGSLTREEIDAELEKNKKRPLMTAFAFA